MKKLMASFILLICTVLFTNARTVKIVTTTPDMKSISEIIGGDKVSVISIATGYQNPHFVDPKPRYYQFIQC